MSRYLAHRIMLAIPTLVGLTILVFVLLRIVIPTDAIDIAFAETGVEDPAAEQRLREQFGITGPLPVQYLRWVGRMFTGDFGTSFYSDRSVTDEMVRRIPASLELGAGALLITVIVAIPLGLISAAKQDSAADYLARGSAILFYAVPGFWIATLVLVFGSLWFNFAPPIDYAHIWEDPVRNVTHLVTPMIILGLSPIGTLIRLVRTQVLEVLRQDYVRTARAKGLGTREVYMRHVLRNSMLPIVTVIGLQLPRLVAGTVIFEQIFVIPGMGRYLLQSVQRLDLFVIMATNLFFGAMLVFSNIVVDVSYAMIDPRIRLTKS